MNLLSFERLVRTNLRLFLMLMGAVALAICVATKPRLPVFRNTANSYYTSSASLVLPSNTRFAMNAIFATTSQSDLDFWITDMTLFEKLVDRLRIGEKVNAKLREKRPDLAPFGNSVRITAFKTGPVQAVIPGGPKGPVSVAGKYGVDAQTFETAPADAEVQYAQLEMGEDDWEVHQNRLNRISIRGVGPTAEDSKLVVDLTVRILRSELEALAVRRAQKRRKSIEGFIAKGNQRVNRLYRKLGQQSAADPDQVQKAKTQQIRLSQSKLKVTADLLSIKRELARLRQTETDDSTSEALQKAERELRQAELLFVPTSFTITQMRERLGSLRAFALRIQAERSAQLAVGLQAKLQQKEAELAKYQAEMEHLKDRLPSPQRVVSYRQLERELATWDTQLLAWERQLLQARIEERLCRGDGTAVVLQGALPGTRPPVVTQQLFAQYRKTLTMLPLAPLAALAGVLIIRLVQGARQIRSRAEYYFDAPVLGELPRLPKGPGRSMPAKKRFL